MRIIEASAYGFCSGVRSAVAKAMKAADKARELGLPCYVCGSLVHSRAVSGMLSEAGITEIDSPSGHEPGVVIIRTHGIGDGLRASFVDSGFIIVDATCPVLLRNAELLRNARFPLLVGSRKHSEISGLLGCRDVPVIEGPDDLENLPSGVVYEAVIQTTLSSALLDDILSKARKDGISITCLNAICRASAERREALSKLIPLSDAIVVVGDSCSANSRELAALAEREGLPSFLVSDPDMIPPEVFGYNTIGLTAGASAPDQLIEAVKRRISEDYGR